MESDPLNPLNYVVRARFSPDAPYLGQFVCGRRGVILSAFS
jgi:hypothetical protein